VLSNHLWPGQRIRAVPITSKFYANMCRVGHLETGHLTIEGVPQEAIFLDVVRHRHWSGAPDLYFIFTHPSFEPVPLDATIPVAHVTMRDQRAAA
jgi:hypothetical protein